MKVLLVEDEKSIVDDVAQFLGAAGFVVETTASGEQAWEMGMFDSFEAIILDLGLPDKDGMEVLKQWRSEGVKTPVLVLTARGDWIDRVEGINQGADDYLPKPFKREELIARLRAIIRRSKGQASSEIICGPARLDVVEQKLTFNGNRAELSPLEFRLVSYLMHNKGKTVSPDDLIEHVYGAHSDRDHNALEALMRRTRQKLPTSLIQTRRGFGYLIDDELVGTQHEDS